MIAGKQDVQFRISFASDHSSTEAGREGFAFDNIRIRERNKKVLMEHFTNTSSQDVREVDGIVNNIYNLNFEDAVKLEYHTSFPGEDPFNLHNSAVPATRSFYYGVSEVPYTILNGGYSSRFRFGYISEELELKDVKAATLTEGLFEINFNTQYNNSNLNTEVEITALKDIEPAERIIHIVVYEKLISGINTDNGAANFLNVVKDMLPNSAGTAVFDSWEKDETRTYEFTWDHSNVYDPEMIRVAAFIQNDESKEVYQVAADDSTNMTTSIKNLPAGLARVNVYPNPANDQVFVHIDADNSEDYTIEFFDQLGRITRSIDMYSWEKTKQINIEGLDRGVYMLRISDVNNRLISVKRMMIFR